MDLVLSEHRDIEQEIESIVSDEPDVVEFQEEIEYDDEEEKKEVFFFVIPKGCDWDYIVDKYKKTGNFYLQSFLKLENYEEDINYNVKPRKGDHIVVYYRPIGIVATGSLKSDKPLGNVKMLTEGYTYQIENVNLIKTKMKIKDFYELMKGKESYFKTDRKFVSGRLNKIYYFRHINLLNKREFMLDLLNKEEETLNNKIIKKFKTKKESKKKEELLLNKLNNELDQLRSKKEVIDDEEDDEYDKNAICHHIPIVISKKNGEPFKFPLKKKAKYKKEYFLKMINSNIVDINDNNEQNDFIKQIQKGFFNFEVFDDIYDPDDSGELFNEMFNAYELGEEYSNYLFEEDELPHIQVCFIKNGHPLYDGIFLVCYSSKGKYI